MELAGQKVGADLFCNLRSEGAAIDHDLLPKTIGEGDQSAGHAPRLHVNTTLTSRCSDQVFHVDQIFCLELSIDGMNFRVAARLIPQTKPGERMIFSEAERIMDDLDIGA